MTIWAALALASRAVAQTASGAWSEPVNLSQSGAASAPRIVVDSNHQVHILWLDAFDGLKYTQGTNTTTTLAEQWRQPIPIQLPFGKLPSSLTFITDPAGFVHAFWIDGNGSLYYSRVASGLFGTPSAWMETQLLANSAQAFAVTQAPDGRIHLVYVRSAGGFDFPAGVYYRYADRVGAAHSAFGGWSPTVMLYTSPYFRNLKAAEAHVTIAAGEHSKVYAAWDDRPQERLLMAQSNDGGKTWGQTQEVDKREKNDGSSAISPSKALLIAQGEDALVLWQAGHEGGSCKQYFRWLPGGSETWSERQPAPGRFTGCPDEIRLLTDDSGQPSRKDIGTMWLMATTGGSISLSAWNHGQWGSSQSQPSLSGFTHPETFRPVNLGCQQGALAGNELLVVGCDTGSGSDIWLLSRQLGGEADWFPTPTPTPVWSTPAVVTLGEMSIPAAALASDARGILHAFWTQAGSGDLVHATFDGQRWSRPESLLTSPGGAPDQPVAILDRAGDVFLAWSDRGSGMIYYSWAPTNSSLTGDGWAAPQPLPAGGRAARSPQVSIDPQGTLTLAYAVPLNEGRGIYLVQSKTGQAAEAPQARYAWSTPEKVFDAAAAGWAMVDQPRLASGIDNFIHLLWTRYSLPPDSSAVELYYARSQGGSMVWTEPQEVANGNVVWSQMLSSPDGTLHRAWQEDGDGTEIVWHQYSLDEGNAWSAAGRVTGFASRGGPVGLTLDAIGRPHLVQVTREGAASSGSIQPGLVLQGWIWSGAQGWVQEDRLSMGEVTSSEYLQVVSPESGLAALVMGQFLPSRCCAAESGDQIPGNGLFFSTRSLALPAQVPTPLPTFTPAPELMTDNQVLPVPSPTPTLVFSKDPGGQRSLVLGNRWVGVAVGAIPAVLVVIWAFVVGVRKVRKT
ncbi:MAG: hypothetical protein KJ606_02060 [Chloroflexi bacterium]|nr:hypothetical protein [Chloroflexota bacterium]